jgi:hypothetical protein
MKEFNYAELLLMTNKEFADDIRVRLEDQRMIREVMIYTQYPYDDGTVDLETIGMEEDAPRFFVEYLVGWAGVPQALWKHEFEPMDGKGYSSVINANQVARYNQMVQLAKKSSEG